MKPAVIALLSALIIGIIIAIVVVIVVTQKGKKNDPAASEKLRCLIVGDLYNIGKNNKDFFTEYELIVDVAKLLFDKSHLVASVGIWVYGNTMHSTTLYESLDKMHTSIQDFEGELWKNLVAVIGEPLTTSDAIMEINEVEDTGHRANALIFFSAQQNTSILPLLDPDTNKSGFKRIVAVGFNETNLENVVKKPRGVALSIPMLFQDKDIRAIVSAILEKR